MRPAVGIVHLGIGAFFRAFGVPWMEDAMAARGGGWGVLGVSLRSGTVRDRLAAADFAYHALEKRPEGGAVRRVEALRGVLVAPEDPAAVVAAMAAPAVSLVTLTVTEKGYCHAPASGRLDMAHPAIMRDIANPEAPETAPGLIVAALARRRAAGLRPFTCLSCDNLPENGLLLRGVVLELARHLDPGLAVWIADQGRFPCSMVDRIVPATTLADVDTVERLAGVRDEGAVVHEPFRQWVIEDDFVDGLRPAFQAADVQMVADVAPFEHMKLRCLNGTHSAIAYLGVLAGKATVSGAVADPAFARFIEGLWRDEIVPGLVAPPGVDLAGYTGALMARYGNPGIEHSTIQIAMDGSQKLPQRILAAMADNLAAGRPVARLALVVAAWVHFLRGGGHEVSDPLAGRLVPAARGATPVAEVLAVRDVFPPELAGHPEFRQAVETGYAEIAASGVQTVLEGWK